jgi:transcriptional regulator with XRE-family HTH domain
VTAPPSTVSAAFVLRSEGQRMLLAVTGSLTAIAKDLGCRSPSAIHHYREGKRTPTPEMRARMYTAYGIPVEAWSVRPGGLSEPEAALEVAQSAAPAGAPSTLEDCLALLAVIRGERQQRGLLASERVKLATAETQILSLRSRLEQAAEFAEARYVLEHPAWIRLRRVIVQALEPYPDAAKAVRDAIARMETR